jgi:hypothetical protein
LGPIDLLSKKEVLVISKNWARMLHGFINVHKILRRNVKVKLGSTAIFFGAFIGKKHPPDATPISKYRRAFVLSITA